VLKKIAVLVAPASLALSLSAVPIAATAPSAAAKLVKKCPPGVTNPAYCRKVFVCPKATGRLHGATLGLVHLFEQRARLERAYLRAGSKITHRHRKYQDVFCLQGGPIRVNYGTKRTVHELAPGQNSKYLGRALWASTANRHYRAKGITNGSSLRKAEKAFPNGNLIPIGQNQWYLSHGSVATIVLKTRHGKVQEVGIAVPQLTVTAQDQATFLRTFH
jgi:hypothetical protein